MAEMRTSIIMQLTDRVTGPVRRIRQSLSNLNQQAGLNRVSAQAQRVSAAASNAAGQAAALGRGLMWTSGISAAAAWGMERLVSNVANTGARVEEMSERLGVNVQWLQEWIYIGRQFGVQTEAMRDGLKELSLRADEFVTTGKGPAAEAWRRLLGEDALQMVRQTGGETEKLFALVRSNIQGINNYAARQRIVDELFGGQGGEQLAELVSQSQSELERFRRQFQESGTGLTEEEIERARRYSRRMNSLRQALYGIQVTVVGELLPGINEWLDRMRDLATANREAISERIIGGLRQLWSGIRMVASAASWAADKVGGFGNLIAGIAGILAVRFVVSLGVAILELLRFSKVVAVSVVRSLGLMARGVISLAARAIPAAIAGVRALSVALLTTPVGWITAAIAAIAGAAYLIYRNWDGLSKWFSNLWDSIKGIVDKGVNAVTSALNPGQLVETGKNWIGGLWAGIQERWGQLTGWLSKKVNGLTSWMPDWAKNGLGLDGMKAPQPRSPESAMGAPRASGGNATARNPRTEVGGELRITVDSEGRPRVRDSERRGPMDLSVDSGPLGVAP